MRAFENKLTGAITSTDFKSCGIQIGYWITFAILMFVSLICVFPILWIFMSSFKDVKEFLSVSPTIFPRSFHPEKLKIVWDSLDFGRYYLNSLVFAAGEIATTILVTGLAGYVISRLRPKGVTLVFSLIMWTMMLPTSGTMVPLFMTFIDFPLLHINLTDTYWPMWMMSGAGAFNVLLFKSFFDSIPMSYLEAARIDGCSSLGIFGKIILPLSKPIIMVVAIFTFNGAWDSFFWPYIIIKNTKLLTVAVQIFKLKSAGLSMDQYVVALLFSIVPPMIIFLLFQKHIMAGFPTGGVKG